MGKSYGYFAYLLVGGLNHAIFPRVQGWKCDHDSDYLDIIGSFTQQIVF